MLLRTKIIIVSIVAVIGPIAEITFSLLSNQRITDNVGQMESVTTAVRNHTIADMVHDGLRSDVYAALLSKDIGRTRQQVETDLSEKAKVFDTAITENKALPLPPDVLAAIKEVEAPLNDYVATARKLIETAMTDRAAALVALPDFDKKFDALELSMEAAGAKIEAAAITIGDNAQNFLANASMLGWSGLVLILGTSAILILFNTFGLLRPLRSIETSMRVLADNKLDEAIPYTGKSDEIGNMARSIEVFRQTALQRAALQLEQEMARERHAVERQAEMARLAKAFQQDVSSVIETVTATALELTSASEQMTNASSTTAERLMLIAVASEQAAVNAQTIATSGEELTYSIKEVSEQVNNSSVLANSAAGAATGSGAEVRKLEESVSRIGSIIGMIEEIAAQTNLLALNATIEAARAGEAGRGFGVVASEVKSLAAQTAKATAEISAQIQSVQNSTAASVNSIGSVTDLIARLDEVMMAIAAAVREQEAATGEIAGSIQQVSSGTQQIKSSLESANALANDARSVAARMNESAKNLTSKSEELGQRSASFLKLFEAA